jgi:hypothetical protein
MKWLSSELFRGICAALSLSLFHIFAVICPQFDLRQVFSFHFYRSLCKIYVKNGVVKRIAVKQTSRLNLYTRERRGHA